MRLAHNSECVFDEFGAVGLGCSGKNGFNYGVNGYGFSWNADFIFVKNGDTAAELFFELLVFGEIWKKIRVG